MKKFKFNAFIPYLCSAAVFAELRDKAGAQEANVFPDRPYPELEPYVAKDPSPTAWRSQGFTCANGDQYLYTPEAGKYLMAVQFNERNLPGSTRDEHLGKLLDEFEQREGRSPNKKDYAMLKEEAEFQLLPKAFIRRTVVPVFFISKYNLVLVGTSSPKRAEDTVSILRAYFDNTTGSDTTWFEMSLISDIVAQMTTMAEQGHNGPDLDDGTLYTTNTAVFKGENKETIRIKDKDLSDHDMQKLLMEGYRCHELGMSYDPNANSEDRLISFIMTDRMVFKRVKFNAGIAKQEYGEVDTAEQQTEAVIWLTARTCTDLLMAVTADFGGYKTLSELKKEAKEEAKAAAKANAVDPLNEDDDDESL